MRKLFTLFAALFLFSGTMMAQFVIIGTGTNNTNGTTIDPVDRYYNYTHCQLIYTAAELAAGGMTGGATITALGFSISEAVPLANFTIKMGLTTQALAQPYISTLTTVKPAFSYVPVVQTPGNFDMITLTTPFTWDGTSNIVVNTCTGSNPYTSPYGGLYYTTCTSGQMTYVRTDGTDNCATTALSSTTYRPNIRFNYTPPPPCTGTPAPGNTTSSANPVCSGASFTLGVQNATSGTGVTYNWQSSANGTTWSNTGVTTSTYTTSITASTYYRCQVTCSGNTGTSTPIFVTLNPFYNCMCGSGAYYTSDEEILNVTIGTLNNSSTCATVAPGAGSINQIYSNYMGYVTQPLVKRTGSQTFSVQIGTCGGNYSNSCAIWIDYNQNGSMLDAGEEVYMSPTYTSGPHYETGSFTVPVSATLGTTAIRIIDWETSTPSSIVPCGYSSWGETEDYLITIYDVPGVTTNAASTITGTGATLNATISANFASTNVTFEYGLTATPPFSNTAPVAAPVTTQNAAVSANITSLLPNTTYYFRAAGTNTGGTVYGTVLSFTTAMVAPVIVTQNPSTIGSTFATLQGTATANNALTTVSFEYGTTPGGPYPNPAAGIPANINGMTATDYYANITGLVINTNYYYRAKAVNGGGTTYGAEKTFYTQCVVPPAPGTITGPAQVCRNGTSYTYSVNQVANGFYYNWIFPLGFTITTYPHSNTVTVNVDNTANTGTISVVAVSDCGAPSTASTKPVTVNLQPVPTITPSSPTCQGVSNAYTTQASMASYNWTVSPDGTITPTGNPNVVNITWSATGSKTVGVTYTNPTTGCPAAAPGTVAITVNPAPVPTITGQTSLCANSGYYNYSTESGKTGYTWSISSGGNITYGSGTNQVQVTWNTPGPQTISVTYAGSNGCYAATPTVLNVSVQGVPEAAGSITGPAEVCFNTQNAVYSCDPIVNAMSYVWDLPAGAIVTSGAGTTSIMVDFTGATAGGNVTVYGNSLCGNGALSAPLAVTLTQLPGPAGAITGPDDICENGSATFTVDPIAGATSYRWLVPAGAVIVSGQYTQSVTVNFPTGAVSGDITIFASNMCGDGAVSPAHAILVKPLPQTPVITLNGDVLSSDAPTGNQWYYNGAMIVGATGQTFTAVYEGDYWDIVTIDGCVSSPSNTIYVAITGVPEKNGDKVFIYPVPNDGSFNLQILSSQEKSFDVSVYNSLGATVYEMSDVKVKDQTNVKVDLRPIPNGIYTVIIRNDEGRIVKKITVNR